MVAIAQPIVLPTTEQLMETLDKFKSMDQKNVGYVTREQYNKVKSPISNCSMPWFQFTNILNWWFGFDLIVLLYMDNRNETIVFCTFRSM